MAGLTVLAVDDEELARNDLAWLLSQVDDVSEVLVAQSGTEALRILGRRNDIDALFLDVQMPGLNGVELVALLKGYKNAPAVAFVTAFDNYAVEAFDLEACDYLVKPVNQARLEETIRRVRASTIDTTPHDSFSTLTCRVGNKSYTIGRDEIVIVEAAGDLVKVLAAGEIHHIRESISSLTAAWSSHGFLRIHRSFLVRASEIKRMRSSGGTRTVEILDRELPVSRRYARLLDDYFLRER